MEYPPMALALLKSILHRNGYDVALSDAGLEYWKHCGGTNSEFMLRSMGIQNLSARSMEDIDASDFGVWTRAYVKRLLAEHRPRAVGISVFTYVSNLAAYYMGKVIREMAPKGTRMMIGGFGASSRLQFPEALGAPDRPSLAETMRDQGIIDTYILGDGERAIVEFMKNLDMVQPDQLHKIKDFDGIPAPDYSDLDIGSYQFKNNLTLPVTGSKGCVRRCTFCDIPDLFGKYVQRDGVDMANECIHLYEKYGAKTLYLTDSLVNGSMKAFMDFISTLAELKAKRNIKDLQWTGQYITRPAHQIPHDRDYYALMAASGAVGVSVGAESGSNRVLKHMDKKMKVEDLFTELDHFRKHRITMVPNVLQSYPTETREDFEDTIKMIKGWQTYLADGTIEQVGSIPWWYTNDGLNRWRNVGPEQGMYHMATHADRHHWWYRPNPELTLRERVFRRLALSKIVSEMRMPISMDENYEIKRMLMWYETNRERNEKWTAGIKGYND
jgi:radical SAM superfamily enzyme YgiQ (UPF0313 family)